MSIGTKHKRLASFGVALATAAATITGGVGFAQAQEKIATHWISAPFPIFEGVSLENFIYRLVDSDSELPVAASGGYTISTVSGPSSQLREYALMTEHASDLGDDELPDGFSISVDEHNGITTVTLKAPAAELGGSLGPGWWGFYNAATFNRYGTYDSTVEFTGDSTYAASSYESSTTITPDMLKNAGEYIQLSIDVAPRMNGTNEISFSTDEAADGNRHISYWCTQYGVGTTTDEVQYATVHDDGSASGSCDTTTNVPVLVHAELSDLDETNKRTQRGGAVLVFDPLTGATSVGIDPDASYAPNQLLTLTNLAPNRTYTAQVHSTPRELGTFTTDAEGVGTVTLPDDLADGHHELVILDGTSEVERHPFTLSQRADPSRSVTIPVTGNGDDNDNDDGAGGADPSPPTSGSLGSLTGILGS